MSDQKIIRCGIYTLKSSEEGLDQLFNSLHAQREACEAFVLSQKHKGWQVLEAEYDDGGFSGGNMERPGLKRLLADISAKRSTQSWSTRSIGLPDRRPTSQRSWRPSMAKT